MIPRKSALFLLLSCFAFGQSTFETALKNLKFRSIGPAQMGEPLVFRLVSQIIVDHQPCEAGVSPRRVSEPLGPSSKIHHRADLQSGDNVEIARCRLTVRCGSIKTAPLKAAAGCRGVAAEVSEIIDALEENTRGHPILADPLSLDLAQ